MGWTMSQVKAKKADWLRRRSRSWMRRTTSPSGVRSLRSRTRWAWASAIWLPRSFAMRTRSEGTPSKRVTTAFRLKITRAVGRENLAKTSPVTRARPRSPTSASTVTSRFAASPRGAIFP